MKHSNCQAAVFVAWALVMFVPTIHADAPRPVEKQFIQGMRNLGRMVKMARSCGIADQNVAGIGKAYTSVLHLSGLIHADAQISAKQKATVATPGELESEYLEGGRMVAASGGPSPKECAHLKDTLPAFDLAMAKLDEETQSRISNIIRKP